MGLFDSIQKKGDSVKTLSEVEIQNKLYGGLRKPHTEEKKIKNIPLFHERKAAADLEAQKNSENSSDLFFPSTPVSSLDPSTESRQTAAQVKKPAHVQQWVDKEQKSYQRNLSQYSGVKPSSLNQEQASSPSTSKQPIPWKSFGQKFLTLSSQSLSWVVGSFFSVFRFFSSRRSKFRKWLPLGGGVLALVLIFLGISSLNTNREVSMKSPRKIAPKALVETAAPTPAAAATSVPTGTSPAPAAPAAAELATPENAKNAPNAAAQVNAPSLSEAKLLPYVIQVATYVNPADAQGQVDQFKKAGFPSFSQPLKRQNGRVYHCVFIGRFKSFDEAETSLQLFKKKVSLSEAFQDSFIRSLR